MCFVFNLKEFKDRVAVIDQSGEQFYYGGLIDISGMLGSYFGTGDKKLVIILAGNNIETITGYLSALQGGHTVMLLDARLDKGLLGSLIGLYHPDFIWGPGESNRSGIYQYKNYQLYQLGWEEKNVQLHPDLALLLSTSGSTGSPKLVMLTRENLMANARSIGLYLNLSEDEKAITILPVHYSYGLSVINSHLAVGATVLLTDTPIVRKDFWDFFKSAAGTSLAGVPYTYEILKRIGFSRMYLPSLRYITQAGGKMDSQLIIEYARLSREKGFLFYVMYGATEATARMAYLSPEYNITKPESIGKPIPNGNIKLIDKSGNTIIYPKTVGQLVFQGPNVMMGYARCRDDLSGGDQLQGVLPTDDLGYFDEEGFFYITGRISRFLKILGNRISLSEIEEHLNNLGFNCYCGGDDHMLLVACVQGEKNEGHQEIHNKIRMEIMIRYKIPLDLIGVFSIKNLPRSASGKVKYGEIFSDCRSNGERAI
ncbi:MAG: hypothetical protein JL50_14380 [Peptococcaceae bacterium BICA1-7]|nr:MAG: hypothetical protein JL50_14380 [Peptococcaceae bacterium BICA1-7]HBV96371.1 hypothetical protein [Desulfotomaculum sp.]